MRMKYFTALTSLACVSYAVDITVNSSGGQTASPHAYGLMFEDINQSGDGGIYAELIQNRAFQYDASNPSPWKAVGGATISVKQVNPPLSNAIPNSINVGGGSGKIGISNPGYWGIPVKAQDYTGTFFVKGAYDGSFTASLQSSSGDTIATVDIKSESEPGSWTQHNFTLTPSAAGESASNVFQLTFDSSGATDGSLDFNFLSLFPPTYKSRENGMRSDIMEALSDLSPKFLRFPGGNDLEGNSRAGRWIWNQTIGPLWERPGRMSTWGYMETGGLGLIEYMHWCDDLGMEPVLAVWDGLSLDGDNVPQDELQPYIDDALNEIEFLTGSADSVYGSKRAALGYPDPWKLNFVEIGNEDWSGQSLGPYKAYRYPMFESAIKQKYPDITTFSSASSLQMDIANGEKGDYHNYDSADGFIDKFHLFDNVAVSNMVGEYATIFWNPNPDWNEQRSTYPWWAGSVGEAVFSIGVERNLGTQFGMAYAPLMLNVNNYQWGPTLLAFSADTVITSTSHAVISALSKQSIDQILPTQSNDGFGPLYYVAGTTASGASVWKGAVYNSTSDVNINLTFEGTSTDSASLTVLTAADPFASNTPQKQGAVNTKTDTVTADGNGVFSFSLPNYSVAVLSSGGS